jgi:hypothetical protein
MSSCARIFCLKILCVNFVRTVGSVHIVIIPSITQFQSGKNLTVQAATALLYCRLILVTGCEQCQIILFNWGAVEPGFA